MVANSIPGCANVWLVKTSVEKPVSVGSRTSRNLSVEANCASILGHVHFLRGKVPL